jgi:hypothetical protein
MTLAELQRLEAAIGRGLPLGVREFFLNFPERLRKGDEDRDPDDSDFELTDDVEALIQMNSDGYDRIIIPGAGANVLALGCGGCGETWWVDLDTEQGAVYFCDAGTYAEDSDHVADSLAEFARGLLDEE